MFVVVGSSGTATITVDIGTDGVAGLEDCRLRDAIDAANGNVKVNGCDTGSDTLTDRIVFADGISVIFIQSELPTITESLEIAGPGRSALQIDGDDIHRQITVDDHVGTFRLSGLSLTQGSSTGGAGCVWIGLGNDAFIEDVDLHASSMPPGTFRGAGALACDGDTTGSTIELRRVSIWGSDGSFDGGALLQNCSGVVSEWRTF